MLKLLRYLVYNIILIIVLFIIIEIIVHIFSPNITTVGTTESIVTDSLYYDTYGLNPNSNGTSHGEKVTIDKHGFRNSNTITDTTKQSWLLLGDSATFGIGVEDDSIFSAIVNNQLNNINVLNPSTIGYNKTSYKDVYQSLIKEYNNKFNIDRVLLIWCLNDVYPDTSVLNAPGDTIRNLFPGILTFIRTHSKSYHFVKTLILDRPRAYFEYDKQFYSFENADFQNSIDVINELHNFSIKNSIIFEILILPYEYQFRSNDFKPQELIVDKLQPYVEVFDISSYIKEYGYSSKDYYLYGDGIHFSNLGHRIIARYIINHIY